MKVTLRLLLFSEEHRTVTDREYHSLDSLIGVLEKENRDNYGIENILDCLLINAKELKDVIETEAAEQSSRRGAGHSEGHD